VILVRPGRVLSSLRRRAWRADCRRESANLQAAGIGDATANRRFARAAARRRGARFPPFGKDPDHVAASLDLAIEPPQWVGRVNLQPMRLGEGHVREDVDFWGCAGRSQRRTGPRQPSPSCVGRRTGSSRAPHDGQTEIKLEPNDWCGHE
jgi:hypothetical protein